jgi:hypothetical protein
MGGTVAAWHGGVVVAAIRFRRLVAKQQISTKENPGPSQGSFRNSGKKPIFASNNQGSEGKISKSSSPLISETAPATLVFPAIFVANLWPKAQQKAFQ